MTAHLRRAARRAPAVDAAPFTVLLPLVTLVS
jgi:hypothetical protein